MSASNRTFAEIAQAVGMTPAELQSVGRHSSAAPSRGRASSTRPDTRNPIQAPTAPLISSGAEAQGPLHRQSPSSSLSATEQSPYFERLRETVRIELLKHVPPSVAKGLADSIQKETIQRAIVSSILVHEGQERVTGQGGSFARSAGRPAGQAPACAPPPSRQTQEAPLSSLQRPVAQPLSPLPPLVPRPEAHRGTGDGSRSVQPAPPAPVPTPQTLHPGIGHPKKRRSGWKEVHQAEELHKLRESDRERGSTSSGREPEAQLTTRTHSLTVRSRPGLQVVGSSAEAYKPPPSARLPGREITSGDGRVLNAAAMARESSNSGSLPNASGGTSWRIVTSGTERQADTARAPSQGGSPTPRQIASSTAPETFAPARVPQRNGTPAARSAASEPKPSGGQDKVQTANGKSLQRLTGHQIQAVRTYFLKHGAAGNWHEIAKTWHTSARNLYITWEAQVGQLPEGSETQPRLGSLTEHEVRVITNGRAAGREWKSIAEELNRRVVRLRNLWFRHNLTPERRRADERKWRKPRKQSSGRAASEFSTPSETTRSMEEVRGPTISSGVNGH